MNNYICMKNKKYSWLILATIAVVFLALIFFSGKVLLRAQPVGEASVLWSTTGLSDCKLSYWDHAYVQQINKEDSPLSGSESLTGLIKELSNFTINDLVSLSDIILSEVLPFHWGAQVTCKDALGNKVWLSLSAYFPQVSMEPKLITQLKTVIGWVGNLTFRKSNYQLTEAQFNWTIDGLKNCTLGVLDQNTGNQYDGGTIPKVGKEVLTKYDIDQLLHIKAKDVVELAENIRGELPFNAQYKVVCQDRADNNVSLSVEINLPKINEPRFITQLRELSEEKLPPSAPKVDLKINNSDGFLDVRVGNQLNLSWNSSNSTSCMISERNNATGNVSEWTVGLSGNYSKVIPSNWAGQQIAYAVLCKNVAGNFSDDVVVVNVGGGVVVPPPIVPPITRKCGVTGGGNEFQIYYYTKSGDECNYGFGSGYVAACYDGTLQVAFPGYNCLSRDNWLKAAQSGCANHCTTGSGELNVNSVIKRLNSDFVKILQGMIDTLTLLIQRPNDPVVGNIVVTFSELSNSIRSTLNYLNQLK